MSLTWYLSFGGSHWACGDELQRAPCSGGDPLMSLTWYLCFGESHWACSDELQRAPHCGGNPLASLTWYMGIGEFCTLVPMHFGVPASSLVLCESCVEPPLACSTRKCKDNVHIWLKEPPLTHVLKIDDGHCSASNAAHKSIFFFFSLLSGACGE
ncbi:hypothetical protein BKA93DRAFT_747589 [Sparassis latifolia]